MLAQGVMAEGIVKHFPGPVRPVIQFCLDHDISIMQMPCPETLCASGGLGRSPRGKKWYEENGLRQTSREIAVSQAKYMRRLVDSGFEILAIIGVEFSPACAVTFLNKGRTIHRDEGIYIEELKRATKQEKIQVKYIGISQRWQKKMLRDLQELVAQPNADNSSRSRIGGIARMDRMAS
jgi:predicted secreted protein